MAKYRPSEDVQGGAQVPAHQGETAIAMDNERVAWPPNGLIAAQWRGFQHLAKALPNRRVLSVELTRTPGDEAAAIFMMAGEGEPVRYVVTRDAQRALTIRVDAPSAAPGSAHATPAEVPLVPAGIAGIIAVAADMLAAAFDAAEAERRLRSG